ncbi:MAG TPA: TlpA disulfide reductase family protein [Actinomycetota bacterium]
MRPPLSLPRARALLAAAAGLLVLAAACGGGGRTDDGSSPGGSLLPEDRLALPELDAERFQLLLAELRGAPVVVNIWASWCEPCRDEGPHLAALAREYEGRVQFVGVDIRDDLAGARAFIEEMDWPYPSISDPDEEIKSSLGYLGQPVTILYDASGAKTFDWEGAIGEDQLRGEIERVL